MELVYAIIFANVVISWKGFNDFRFFEKYKFNVEGILHRKEQIRMLSSGFLHGDYMHLAFNMLSFYFFAGDLIHILSWFEFLVVYFGSLLAGNLLSLYIHRNHSDYSAIGASGAVSGIIYAHIALIPGGKISLLILPIVGIPSWIFGIVYILYSIFGIKSQRDNIGHEAHLGGAITGLILVVALLYNSWPFDYLIISLILIPTLAFLYLLVYHPEWLMTGSINWDNNPINRAREKRRQDQWKQQTQKDQPGRASDSQKNRDEELNELLDKVNRVGMNNLTEKERKRLEELSR